MKFIKENYFYICLVLAFLVLVSQDCNAQSSICDDIAHYELMTLGGNDKEADKVRKQIDNYLDELGKDIEKVQSEALIDKINQYSVSRFKKEKNETLREWCELLGLDPRGTKQELSERLYAFFRDKR